VLLLSSYYKLDPCLLGALVSVESAWRSRTISPVGAIGYGQLMPGTAATLDVNALEPYENLDGVTNGTALYGCRLAMVGCHQVGTVIEVLPGEVTFKHPHRDSDVRGQMVELRMTDADALARARGGDADAPAYASLVRYQDVAAANPRLAANATVHPDRLVWVVTVHANVVTRARLATPPRSYQVYSLVIDDECAVALQTSTATATRMKMRTNMCSPC